VSYLPGPDLSDDGEEFPVRDGDVECIESGCGCIGRPLGSEVAEFDLFCFERALLLLPSITDGPDDIFESVSL
jgi:hypothetical protein